jgi:hypothetical protein
MTVGGVYRMVKEAMRETLAEVLGLRPDARLHRGRAHPSAESLPANTRSACLRNYRITLTCPRFSGKTRPQLFFAIRCTIHFWWENIKGIPESSQRFLHIMCVVTVRVILSRARVPRRYAGRMTK